MHSDKKPRSSSLISSVFEKNNGHLSPDVCELCNNCIRRSPRVDSVNKDGLGLRPGPSLNKQRASKKPAMSRSSERAVSQEPAVGVKPAHRGCSLLSDANRQSSICLNSCRFQPPTETRGVLLMCRTNATRSHFRSPLVRGGFSPPPCCLPSHSSRL